MSCLLSNDFPVLDCHSHLKISHFMTQHSCEFLPTAETMSVDPLLRSPSHRGHSFLLRIPTSLFIALLALQAAKIMFVICLLRSPSTPFYDNSFSMLRNPASLFSLHFMLRNHAPLFSRLLVPLKRHISAVSLPRLLLFVEHRYAATHPPQPPRVCKTHVFYSPTHGNYLLWFQKENPCKLCPPGTLLAPAQCPRSRLR